MNIIVMIVITAHAISRFSLGFRIIGNVQYTVLIQHSQYCTTQHPYLEEKIPTFTMITVFILSRNDNLCRCLIVVDTGIKVFI